MKNILQMRLQKSNTLLLSRNAYYETNVISHLSNIKRMANVAS